MNRYRFSFAIPLLLQAIILASCYDNYRKDDNLLPPDPNIVREEAYVPVYSLDSVTHSINRLAPQPTVQAGKIYVYGNYLFQVEKLKGVHIIDFSDRKNPVKLGFVASEGCAEVAVKNGYLITNNLEDLVSIDISNKDSVKVVARIENAFPEFASGIYGAGSVLPPIGKYFICPDYSHRGQIIEWKLEKNVKGASCIQ